MIEKVVKCDGCKQELSARSTSSMKPDFASGTIEISNAAFKTRALRIFTWVVLHFCGPSCLKLWVDNTWNSDGECISPDFTGNYPDISPAKGA